MARITVFKANNYMVHKSMDYGRWADFLGDHFVGYGVSPAISDYSQCETYDTMTDVLNALTDENVGLVLVRSPHMLTDHDEIAVIEISLSDMQ